MKLKKITRMLAVSLLSLTTMMSITMSAFAVDPSVEDNVGSEEGQFGAGENGKPGHDEWIYGYRVSIVDGKTGASLGSVDLTTGGFYDNADTCYTAVGTDKSTAGSTGSAIGGQAPYGMPPAPVEYDYSGKYYYSNGDAVNDWMMSKNPAMGKQNIVDLALVNFTNGDVEREALYDKIKSGEVKICNEPTCNIPLYEGQDKYLGERITGTIRDIVKVLQDRNLGVGGYMSPVVRTMMKAFLWSVMM